MDWSLYDNGLRHERVKTNKYELSSEKLLDITDEISSHQRCLNSLMTEVYKCLNGISADIINDIFAVPKHPDHNRYYQLFVTDRP